MGIPPDVLKDTLRALVQEIMAEGGPSEPPRYLNHQDAVAPWIQALKQGTFAGKPFSKYTIGFYTQYVSEFLRQYAVVNFENLELALNEMPVEYFSKRSKYYNALICFGKYLIRNHSLPEAFLLKAKTIQPKRHLPPRRLTITADQLQALLQACRTDYELLLILMLSSTGLRAGEFCALQRKDLHLEKGYLTIENGKGGKRRRVGLNDQVLALLENHIRLFQITDPEEYLFLDALFRPLDPPGLRQRLAAIGKRAGVHVHPHALRRAFVTLNANKGRSLVMLQIACGHSDIKTTRSYCQTSEEEVVQAMREWT